MRIPFHASHLPVMAQQAGQPSFIAPLLTSVVPQRASGSYSFTRATTATITDWEGCIKNVLSGEIRFKGARRVGNLTTSATIANGGNVTLTLAAGTYVFSMGAGTGTATFSGTGGAAGTLAADASLRTAVAKTITAGTLVVTASVADLVQVQIENVTGQTNQNPSEYVAIGASSPYYGANVDGVKYFSKQNVNVLDQNLLVQSQTFDVTWSPSETTVSPDAIAAPDSTLTADALLETVANANHYIEQNCTVPTINAPYTLSVYAKANGRTTGQVEFDDGTNGVSVDYDLAAGTISGPNNIGAGFSNQLATITNAGNGWFRISVTGTIASTAVLRCFLFIGTGIYAGDITKGLYLWGGQLQPGISVGTYVPTVAAAVTGTTVTQPTTDGIAIPSTTLLGYLAEEQRTNIVLQNSNFGATWAAVATPTRVAANDQCGDIALDLIGDNDGAALEGYTQTITFTANAAKSVSFLVKKGTSTSTVIRLRDTTAGADRLLMAITWVGTVPTSTYTTGSEERAAVALANGVYRIHCKTTSVTAANTNSLQVYPATTAALAVAGTGTVSIGGVQAEDALYATSLIPTTTTTATRNGDALKFPIAGNANEATSSVYCEVSAGAVGSAQALGIGGDAGTNRQVNRIATSTSVSDFDGVNNPSLVVAAIANNSPQKIASAWSGIVMKISCQGITPTVGVYNGDIFSTDSNFTVGGFFGAGTSCTVRNLKIWQRALSSGELIQLTT